MRFVTRFNITSVALVLIFVTHCSCDYSAKKEQIKDPKVENEISSLFSSMAPKSSPLYICDSELGGIEYQPPETIECDSEPHETDTTKIVNITLFWTDVSKHIIKGYECMGTVSRMEATYFMSTFMKSKTSYGQFSVSEEECWKMLSEQKSPKGDELYRTADEVVQTVVSLDINEPWFYAGSTLVREVFNYRIQEVQIGVREVDGVIRTTAMLEEECRYNASKCQTSQGLLIWKGEDVKMCRLLEGEHASCLFRNGTDGVVVTCPDLALSLRGFSLVDMCGVSFGYSQGIYFLQNNASEISEQMAIPSMILHKISGPRHKRETEHKKIHGFEAEIKANLNFLYETIRKGTSDAIWKLEKKYCELNRSQLELLSALSQSGHASLTTRFMYKDPGLRATYEGDLLSIYKCIEVYEYILMERTICTHQWPVKYVYKHTIYDGFIEPQSHTIAHTAQNQSVSSSKFCKRFFFKTKDYVALLGKKGAIKINADVLPQPSKHHESPFPEITFLPLGQLKATSDDEMESLFKLVRESQVRNYAPNIATQGEVKVHASYGTSSGWFFGIFAAIGNFIFGIFSFFGMIGNIVFILIVFAVIAVAIAFLKQFPAVAISLKVICMPFNLLSGICKLFASRSGYREVAKRVRTSRREKSRKEQKSYAPSAPQLH